MSSKYVIFRILFTFYLMVGFGILHGAILEERNDKYFYNVNSGGKLLYPLFSIEDYIIYDPQKITQILNSYEFNKYVEKNNIKLKVLSDKISISMEIKDKFHREEVYIYKNGLIFENYVTINEYQKKYYNYDFYDAKKKTEYTFSILYTYNKINFKTFTMRRELSSIDIPYDQVQKRVDKSYRYLMKYDIAESNDEIDKYINFENNFIFNLDNYKPELYGAWAIENEIGEFIIVDSLYCSISVFNGICKDFNANGENGSFTLLYWDKEEKKENSLPVIYVYDSKTNILKIKFKNFDDPWISCKQVSTNENHKYFILFSSSSYFAF